MRETNRELLAPARDGSDLFTSHHPLLVRFPPDELISQAGAYAAGVYLITTGVVRETYRTPHAPSTGTRCSLLGPGELVGWEILLPGDNELHLTSCRTATETCVSFLERKVFAAAIHEDGELRSFVLQGLASRQLATLTALSRYDTSPADRLCSLLIELAARFGTPTEDDGIALPSGIDRRVVTELTGLSSRQLAKAWSELPGLRQIEGRLRYSAEHLSRWREDRRAATSSL